MPAWYKQISLRPKAADKRSELGHWERDTMYVKDREMLLVAVDRRSRFMRITKLKTPTFVAVAKQTPGLIRVKGVKPMTITNDRGAEFRGQTKIKTPIYYCDAQSPQQRGTVENTIGLLRQFIKRSTDINSLSDRKLKALERRFNQRPRKCLGYRTPHEVMFDLPVALAT